ncbi:MULTISPECIES: Rpn family recombination-promoting nuclease/putative transposase [unclassified Sphingobacterium]|uniref:Rpn family recombination-promoting nuclease/putative transposase n=1 Tax=unclassified Sphingobacterium TaxID=2609468 RepID=UPI00104B71BD|nr:MULTISPECIES: Rpn family recombination-promoting nuclease/putative transposase [unclassified Sphingobacterium]MCS3556891.1 putative transposase/invertase (TIGR01784 family) [Sphingobacterium sp. JUb21]TCQ98896.1 putative transposase/invertase (TIGR01784 family) [Sphingobacterium sp. JUb20]
MVAHAEPVFIDPTTDEGFKRLFGDKVNLINFLNIIFRGRKTITDLTYRDTERIGATEEIGKVIFDLVVQISTGEEIIIEMQTSTQTNLKQRMLYYTSKVISDTAPKGNRKAWGYAIPEVYTIVLMDGFHMPGGDHKTYFHDTCLCNRDSGKIFYEGFGFIYLELINFVKSEAEVGDELDKVFFMLKNMSTLKTLPRIMKSAVFQRFFQLASYAKLTKEERTMYDISLKRKWDAEAVRMYQEGLEKQLKEAIREAKKAEKEAKRVSITAKAEGVAEGEYKKAMETALKLTKIGLSVKQIAEATGLTNNEIEKLK